jgi:hypothetical protein
MSNVAQPRFLVRPGVIRNIGLALFFLSFVLPPGHALFVPTMGEHARDYLKPFGGLWVFIQTPAAITFLPLWRGPPLDDGFTPYEILIRAILFGAWLGNFTVFFRLPPLAALVVIALPWIAFICWFPFVVGFVPFYFWALGIAFVHLSRIVGSRPDPAHALDGRTTPWFHIGRHRPAASDVQR